jgi:hypothetical protein
VLDVDLIHLTLWSDLFNPCFRENNVKFPVHFSVEIMLYLHLLTLTSETAADLDSQYQN